MGAEGGTGRRMQGLVHVGGSSRAFIGAAGTGRRSTRAVAEHRAEGGRAAAGTFRAILAGAEVSSRGRAVQCGFVHFILQFM